MPVEPWEKELAKHDGAGAVYPEVKMSSVIDLDLYRDCHLIVEGEPLPDSHIIKWTLTGEKRETVEKAAAKLKQQTSKHALFVVRQLPRFHPRYPWFQTIGLTSDNAGAEINVLLLGG